MKRFAILGLGRFGKELALQLARSGAEVLAVDKNQELVNEIADEVTRAASADIQDKDALQDLGVADCDVVILSVGGNLAVSVLTVMNLKSLGVRHLVCKAYDELHREVLQKLGADQVLIPEKEMAVKLLPPGSEKASGKCTSATSLRSILLPSRTAEMLTLLPAPEILSPPTMCSCFPAAKALWAECGKSDKSLHQSSFTGKI